MPLDPTFGGTVLRRPAMQSPNFVTGSAGWTINADGTVEFNSGTFRGTVSAATIIGSLIETSASAPQVQIDSTRNAIFVYDAATNLIASLASTAGTDFFGHPYPAGLMVTTGTISGATFEGTNFEINAAGSFFYSGTPATGNLIASIANAAGTDGHSNAYLAGVTSYLNGGTPTAVSLNGGIITYSAFITGSWLGLADIGFQQAASSGTLLLQAGTKVKLGQAGNAFWDEVNQQLGLPAASLVAAPSGTAETWHDMRPLSNSWVGTLTGQYPPQYRLMADGFVEVFGYVQAPNTGNPNGVTFATLPSAYRPGSHVISWPVTMDQEPSATVAFTPRCEVATTGALSIHQAPTAYTTAPTFNIMGRFPLNSTGLITV